MAESKPGHGRSAARHVRSAQVVSVRHLLSIAEVGAFRPLWSDHVLEELRRNLIKAGAKPEAVEHRLGQMAAHFPDAGVAGHEQLIGSMTNHPKDRHMLAAAVAGRADVLVTENL